MPACPETERFAALLRSLKNRSGLSYEALAQDRHGRIHTAPLLPRHFGAPGLRQRAPVRHRLRRDPEQTADTAPAVGPGRRRRTEPGSGDGGRRRRCRGRRSRGTVTAPWSREAVEPGAVEPGAVEVGPVRPVRQGRFGRDQFRQGRFRVVVIGAVVLTLGVSAWALTTDHPSSGSSGGGSAADGRLLFLGRLSARGGHGPARRAYRG